MNSVFFYFSRLLLAYKPDVYKMNTENALLEERVYIILRCAIFMTKMFNISDKA